MFAGHDIEKTIFRSSLGHLLLDSLQYNLPLNAIMHQHYSDINSLFAWFNLFACSLAMPISDKRQFVQKLHMVQDLAMKENLCMTTLTNYIQAFENMARHTGNTMAECKLFQSAFIYIHDISCFNHIRLVPLLDYISALPLPTTLLGIVRHKKDMQYWCDAIADYADHTVTSLGVNRKGALAMNCCIVLHMTRSSTPSAKDIFAYFDNPWQ